MIPMFVALLTVAIQWYEHVDPKRSPDAWLMIAKAVVIAYCAGVGVHFLLLLASPKPLGAGNFKWKLGVWKFKKMVAVLKDHSVKYASEPFQRAVKIELHQLLNQRDIVINLVDAFRESDWHIDYASGLNVDEGCEAGIWVYGGNADPRVKFAKGGGAYPLSRDVVVQALSAGGIAAHTYNESAPSDPNVTNSGWEPR